MVKESDYKKVKFTSKEIAQAFIDKFESEDKKIFVPAPFDVDGDTYWGVGIASTNKHQELEHYSTFVDNCLDLGLRPRYTFLNRTDSKKILDGKMEELGLPWFDDEDYEVPVGMSEPIEEEDVEMDEEGEAPLAESYARDYDYYVGVPMKEAVLPINVNKNGLPDGRRKSTKDMRKSFANLINVEVIPLTGEDEDIENFKTELRDYAKSDVSLPDLEEGVTFKFGINDLVIRAEVMDAEVMSLISQYIQKEGGEGEEPLTDIDAYSDIPDMEF